MLSLSFLHTMDRPIKPTFLLTALALLLSLAGLHGQEAGPSVTANTFVGNWRADFPNNTQFHLIVRPNGRVSYFSNLDVSSNVSSATGRFDSETRLYTIAGPSGESFTLRRGTSVFEVTHIAPNQITSEGTITLLPSSEVGKWSTPPNDSRLRFTTLADAEGFFGTWEVALEGEVPFFIVIEENRDAAASYAASEKGPEGLRGRWIKRGDELHVFWDSGHYTILRELPDRYEAVFFAIGDALNQPGSGRTVTARRVSRTAAQPWIDHYESTRHGYSVSVSVFQKRSQVRKFYRGDWEVVDRNGEQMERIDFRMFQRVRSNREGGVRGSWRTQGDWAYITWSDTLRAIVQPVDNRFVMALYLSDQALDGTPYKVFPIIPDNRSKLTRYERNREKATERLNEFLETERQRAENRRERESGFSLWPF